MENVGGAGGIVESQELKVENRGSGEEKTCREQFAVQKEVRMIFSRVFGFESRLREGLGYRRAWNQSSSGGMKESSLAISD
jgi:hypothetical protein